MKNAILLIIFAVAFGTAIGQKAENITIKFHVDGICGMCEERIENALDTKGVKYADWDRQTHICEVIYRPDKISEADIHKLLNEAGHDTELSKASEEAYSGIHSCCRYREESDH
ncbi:MAG: heavy-metal-associated domain-containing protein [Vicingaceae bacterium]